jgi:hypothetical protein
MWPASARLTGPAAAPIATWFGRSRILAQAYLVGLPVCWAQLFEAQVPFWLSQYGYSFQREHTFYRATIDQRIIEEVHAPNGVGRVGGLQCRTSPITAEPADSEKRRAGRPGIAAGRPPINPPRRLE